MSPDNNSSHPAVATTMPIATGVAPPHSVEAEMSVIGGVLLSDRALRVLVDEERLRPEHFYRERHRLMFAAMIDLLKHAETPDVPGSIVDVLILTEYLRSHDQLDDVGGKSAIDELTGGVPGLGGIRKYAQIVKLHAEKRRILSATYEIQAGIINHNDDAVADGIRLLDAQVVATDITRPRTVEVEDARAHMMEWLTAKHPPGFPCPWPGLYRALKLRPGHTTVLASWTNCGKSQVGFQQLAYVAQKITDARCVAWITEMTPEEHWVRQLVRDGAGNFDDLMEGNIEEAITRGRLDGQALLRALSELPFGIQPVSGWPIEDICRDIRQVQPTFGFLDHFHALAGVSKTQDADEAISMLVAAAKQANTHLIIAAQLNNARWDGAKPPPPTLRDLRNTGSLAQLVSNVVFLHRDSEVIEDPGSDGPDKYEFGTNGYLHVAKAQTGRVGNIIPVEFNAARLDFRERSKAEW